MHLHKAKAFAFASKAFAFARDALALAALWQLAFNLAYRAESFYFTHVDRKRSARVDGDRAWSEAVGEGQERLATVEDGRVGSTVVGGPKVSSWFKSAADWYRPPREEEDEPCGVCGAKHLEQAGGFRSHLLPPTNQK
jgi:hypothetical protein